MGFFRKGNVFFPFWGSMTVVLANDGEGSVTRRVVAGRWPPVAAAELWRSIGLPYVTVGFP